MESIKTSIPILLLIIIISGSSSLFATSNKKVIKQFHAKKSKARQEQMQEEHDSDPIYSNFDNGMIFIVMANFSGSLTDPHIGANDLKSLGADYFKGDTGFIMGAEAQLGYVFGRKRWFAANKTKELSAFGLFFYFGISEGVATQASGSAGHGNVFFSAKYTPVLTFGLAQKTYFFYNRFAMGANIGARMIADPAPEYYFYSDVPDIFPTEVGTLIVKPEMMKKMNAVAFSIGGFLEYNQPILRVVQMVLRLYGTYHLFKPKYITMPPKLENAAIKDAGFDPTKPLKTFYLNSFDFGFSVGLSFKA